MTTLKLKPLQAVAVSIASRRSVSSSSRSLSILFLNPQTASRRESLPSSAVLGSRAQGHQTGGAHANPFTSMMGKRELGVMSAEDIEKRINRFLSLTTEAKHCIQDCDESAATEFEEEFESARIAVDSASIAYSELLEELALTDEGVMLLNEVRKMYAPAVESLREELKSLLKMKAA